MVAPLYLIGLFLLLLIQPSTCVALPFNLTKMEVRELSGDEKIKDLVIVGTHDACAYVSGGPLAICQNGTLKDQLAVGVRAFDIRLRAVGDGSGDLIAYHGIANQGLEWSHDIFPVFRQFLEDNPDQFLILSFKKEGDQIKGQGKDYHEALHRALSSAEQAPWFIHTLTEETKVRDVAGRIIALQRSDIEVAEKYARFGSWEDDATFYTTLNVGGETVAHFYIQDEYKIEGTSAGDKKGAIISAFGHVANKHEEHSTLFNIFYISGTGALCYPNKAAEILNPYVADYLSKNKLSIPGIYFIDFVNSIEGMVLIEQLLVDNE